MLTLTAFFLWAAAYNKALEDAVSVLDKIAMTVDVNDRKFIAFIFPYKSSVNVV